MIVTNWPNDLMALLNFFVTAVCAYFFFRCLFRTEHDVITATKALVVVVVVLAASMLYESHTNVNLFGTYLGGAPTTPLLRDGVVRAQATFGHSILAGCFGATLIPLFFWLWKREAKISAVAGIVGSTVMVLTAHSSTPILAYVAGVLGLLLWPVRRSMKVVRWAIMTAIVALAIVMNAPL